MRAGMLAVAVKIAEGVRVHMNRVLKPYRLCPA